MGCNTSDCRLLALSGMANASVVDVLPTLSSRRRLACLVVLFLVATASHVDRHIVAVILEPIRAEFGVSDARLGILSGLSFAIFYVTLGIPVARWADRGDRRFIIVAALVTWSAFTALCGAAQTFWQLALARVGVGAGEAGAIPPGQSLLADYYPPAERSRAMAVFTLAATAGYLLGLSVGGWYVERYGWRATLVAAGLPGLLLALVARVVLVEPRGGRRSGAPSRGESLRTVFATLAAKRCYVLIVASMILYMLLAYGALVFTASFLVRVHHLTIGQAGGTYGAVTGAGAALGMLLGGVLTDRLAARDLTWLCRLPAIGLVLAWPFHVLAYLAPSVPTMMTALFFGVIATSSAVPAQYSALHAVCGSTRRAMAVAVAFFFMNLLGMGLGPVIAGALSDALAARHGAGEGLRYAIVAMLTMFLPSGVLMWRAARHLPHEVEA